MQPDDSEFAKLTTVRISGPLYRAARKWIDARDWRSKVTLTRALQEGLALWCEREAQRALDASGPRDSEVLEPPAPKFENPVLVEKHGPGSQPPTQRNRMPWNDVPVPTAATIEAGRKRVVVDAPLLPPLPGAVLPREPEPEPEKPWAPACYYGDHPAHPDGKRITEVERDWVTEHYRFAQVWADDPIETYDCLKDGNPPAWVLTAVRPGYRPELAWGYKDPEGMCGYDGPRDIPWPERPVVALETPAPAGCGGRCPGGHMGLFDARLGGCSACAEAGLRIL